MLNIDNDARNAYLQWVINGKPRHQCQTSSMLAVCEHVQDQSTI